MENGISVLKARPSLSYCLTISVMPLADTLKESPAEKTDSPMKSIRSVKILPTFDAVFSAAPVSSRTSAARVRMSMSSFAIIEKCWFIAKVKGQRRRRKDKKKAYFSRPGQDARDKRIIWCGWAGNGKSSLRYKK